MERIERPAPDRQTPRDRSCPVVWHPDYEVDIGPHVFPTAKYRHVRERLLAEGTVRAEDLTLAEPAADADVARVHTARYLEKIRNDAFSLQERFTLEVPFSPALRKAAWLCAGGTMQAARLALEHGRAMHLGGGFHHAFADHGEGFCLINDIAIAACAVIAEGSARHVLVIDLDVHHGNGTADIFAQDDSVFTFSMHQQNNYPFVKPAGDLDIGLRDGTGDEEFLDLLEASLERILADRVPDLALYLAGADPYRGDQLGGLNLTMDGLRRRDRVVFDRMDRARVPVAVAPAGGYALRERDTVEIHCNTVRELVRGP